MDASQELFLGHSPCLEAMTSRNQRDQRQSFAFALREEQRMNRFAVIQAIMFDGWCLFSSDVQDCTHICQLCTCLKLHSPSFQFGSVPSKFGIPMVFLVSRMPPASADMITRARGQIPSDHWITGSRSFTRQERKTSQAAFPATLQPT